MLYELKRKMIDETKYTKHYNFQIKEGWDGKGYLVFSQGMQFNTFSSTEFKQGFMFGDLAILFNDNFEIDNETQKIIKLLIKKSKRNKKLNEKTQQKDTYNASYTNKEKEE